MKKYRAVIFDLDNTLIDEDISRKYAIEKILKERKMEYTEDILEKFLEIDDKFWDKLSYNEIYIPENLETPKERVEYIRAKRMQNYFTDLSLKEAGILNDKYTEYLSEKIVPFKETKEILKYLKDKGYLIYIATNGPISLIKSKIDAIGESSKIDEIFSGEKIASMKPEIKFF